MERTTGTVRGVIVTAAGPAMGPALRDFALPSFRAYASRWGYDVHAEELQQDGRGADAKAQQAKWAKVGLLREALRAYPMALWLDADVLVLRSDEDVAQHLHPAHFQGLVLEQVPAEHRVNPNTGVWLLRSSAEAVGFLDAVERAGAQPGPWADQGAVLVALGWHRGDMSYHWAAPGRANRFTRTTSWLPPGWNQPYVGCRSTNDSYNSTALSYADRPVVARPHALHFMGMTPDARYRAMAQVLAGRRWHPRSRLHAVPERNAGPPLIGPLPTRSSRPA